MPAPQFGQSALRAVVGTRALDKPMHRPCLDLAGSPPAAADASSRDLQALACPFLLAPSVSILKGIREPSSDTIEAPSHVHAVAGR
jgi:hypothetical protein